MDDEQKAALIALLWDYLERDPEHPDRRQTGFGTKTQIGLIASVERVVNVKATEDRSAA